MMRPHRILTCCAAVLACAAAVRAEERAVNLESLLKEMIDPSAVARWPDPPYTCRQASSYDRRSKTPDDPGGWFANTDNMDGSGDSLRWQTIGSRRECVLMDVDGPGAVVRFWTGGQPPKGTVRFYLDGAQEPAIEAPLYDLLAGKSFVPRPLAIENAGAAGNLYLPVPYARHCKITYDEAKPGNPNAPPPGRWYNIEYRTYPAGTAVKTFTMDDFKALGATVARVCQTLIHPEPAEGKWSSSPGGGVCRIDPGREVSIDLPPGPGAVRALLLSVEGDGAAMRTTIVRMVFDGEETVWCPVGDFMGMGAEFHPIDSWYRAALGSVRMGLRWVMPYQRSAKITVLNLGREPVSAGCEARVGPWQWDARSMHFHANWRQERGIPTRPYQDWNYIAIRGKGVYVGDTLALFNPVTAWWGEGDEKIRVDGERFPSHFGTGSEDYYGYAWGNPTRFQGPFANQVRADGPGNMGHTTNTRTRSLDAIPFTKSLRTDIEVWHWADCKVNYAVATYWYALPSATSNRGPEPAEATAPIPEPPDRARRRRIPGAVECETMPVVAKSPGIVIKTQDVSALEVGPWSDGKQMFVRANKPGDFVELRFPVPKAGPKKVTLYGTKSWDYGILRFSVNGKPAAKDYDAYSKQSMASGPVELGTFDPKDAQMVLRVEVVGANPASKGTKSYFGLDAVVLSAP
ncbi:MAG TPA: glycoside hydrolase family 172 protein [Phycisphaerae bacterium]|nr:glycoside hydrolase family 172 protein [Phycisphaerae bacterium]